MSLQGLWVKKWEVPKSSGEGFWIVALSEKGVYGCSCPVWKFRRLECKHIVAVKGGQFKEGEKITPEQVAEAKFQSYKQRGYRYIIWDRRRPYLQDYKDRYCNGNGDFKIISYQDIYILMIKNTEDFYWQELNKFLDRVKEFLKSRSKVLYGFTRPEYKEQLKKNCFDLTQLLLYNKNGFINPNLTKDNFSKINSKLLELQKKYGI